MRSITLSIINISTKIRSLLVLTLSSAVASIAFIKWWLLCIPILYAIYIAYCMFTSKAKLTTVKQTLRYESRTQVIELIKPISYKAYWNYSFSDGAKYSSLESAKVVAGENVINVYIEVIGKSDSKMKFLDQIKYSSVFPNGIEYQNQDVNLNEFIPIQNYSKLKAFLDFDKES